MKQSDRITYEKPELSTYGLFCTVKGADGLSQGGDIAEGCDPSGFDE